MAPNGSNTKKVDFLDDFSFVEGGLIHSIIRIFRGKNKKAIDQVTLSIILASITWVPLCILALVSGTLNDSATTINFFEDLIVHIRFLVAIPFLILVEKVVGGTFSTYLKQSSRIIPDEYDDAYWKYVAKLDKIKDSVLPETLLLLSFFVSLIIEWHDISSLIPGRNYLSYGEENRLNAAGWYYIIISLPIYQLVLYRWLWRWIIWVYSVLRISRFRLRINPLHADKMAGLEFLNTVPLTFSFILIPLSAILSAFIAMDIIYHGAVFSSYVLSILVYTLLLPMIIYAPLLAFIPALIRAKSYGIFKFGDLVRKHNMDYSIKWLSESRHEGEQLLGTLDNSSLADINGSYEPIREMKIIPIDFRLLITSTLLILTPFIPLIFTKYSFRQVVDFVVQLLVS